MAQQVQIPDGTILEFPDGMSQPDIAAAIYKNFPNLKPQATPSAESAAKRVELVKQMDAARMEGARAESVANIAGFLESQAKALSNPIATTEKGIEAAATLISGSPQELIVKPSETKPLFTIPQIPQQEGKTAQVAAGVGNAVVDFANFMATPEGFAMLGIGGLPAALRKSTLLTISTDMAAHAPEAFNAAIEAAKAGNVQEAAKAATTFLAGTSMSALAANHALTAEPGVYAKLNAADAPKTAEAMKEAVGGKAEEVKPVEAAAPVATESKPDATASVKAVEDFIQFEQPEGQGIKAKLVEKKEDFLRKWVNDLRELENVEREGLGGELAPGAKSPTKVATMTTQASSVRARSWAIHGMTDFAGNKTGPALREIFGRDGVVGDERQAVMYAVAKRADELHGRGINPGIDATTVKEAIAALETPARAKFAQEVHDWNRGALQYLKDAGGLSDAAMDAIGLQNRSYIPFFRVFEREGGKFPTGGRSIGDTPQTIKRIKGSERRLVDPTESMQQHANQIIAVADKIRVARTLTELAESNEVIGQYVREVPADKVPIQFDVKRIQKQLEEAGADLTGAELDSVLTLFQNSQRNPQGQNVVSFVKDGKRKFYELDPDLYRTLQALDHHRIHPVLDALLGKPSRAIRLGATGIRAGFTLITNPIRDFTTLLLQSKFDPAQAGRKFFEHLGKQISMKDSELKNIWRSTGGELSQPLGMDRASLQRAVDDVMSNTAKQKALNVLKHPVDAARQAMSFTEAAPRLAEFEMQLRKMGWKPGDKVTNDMAVEAANAAAEVTLNFRRAGAYGRMVNQAVAFFNPNVQGLSKFNRAHTENKKAALIRGTALITVPAIANWWINKDDPDWQNFPPYIKYGFFNFKTEIGWVRLPTPFEWWYVYGATPMATLDALYRENPKAVTDLMAQAARQLTPPVIPSAVEPIAEAVANRSFLTGKPLVGKSLERLDPQEQVNPYTTATAKHISEILSVGGVDVSPIHVDHVIRGETGGFGTDVIQAAERATGTSPVKEPEPADIPVVGRLFIRDSGGVAVDDFYTELQHLETKKATHDKLMKSQEEERAQQYQLEPGEMQKLLRLRRASKLMQGLRKKLEEATAREDRQKIYREMRELSELVLERGEPPK